MNRLRLRRMLRAELGRALKQYPWVCGTAREAPVVASSGAIPSPGKPRGTRTAKRRDTVGTPSPLNICVDADIAQMIGRMVSPIGDEIAAELGGGMAEMAVGPLAPAEPIAPRKLIDLSRAPSSMEAQAERWAAKG